MQKIITLTIGVFLSYLSQAQYNKVANNESFSAKLGAAEYSFEIGTQVGTSFNDSYWFSSYFSPSVKVDLTKKFSVVAGIGARYTDLSYNTSFPDENNQSKSNLAMNSIFGYASGVYKLNAKVNLNATMLFEEVLANTTTNQAIIQKQYRDLSLGVNYNVSPNFSINAQVNMSDRPMNTLFNNSHTNIGLNSPFGYSPFF